MSDEKIKAPKQEEMVSKAEFDKLKIALEFSKDENKSSLQTIKQLEALRVKEQQQMAGIKLEAEFTKNGGKSPYIEHFKKLTHGTEAKKIDYEALKTAFPSMFSSKTQSTASPINETGELNGQGAGRTNVNQNKTVGMSGQPRGSQEWLDPSQLKADS